MEVAEHYFPKHTDWYDWLSQHHDTSRGIYLIFYKVENKETSMRWEEAVKVALCFGWIDSTVKSIGNGKRRQYFCPRQSKSVWSALNKSYIKILLEENLMHDSGRASIKIAKQNGSWTTPDAVEKGIIPEALQRAFNNNPKAFKNYHNFAPSYRKSYLYWLNQAKREATRQKRIKKIIELCEANIKSRDTW